MSGYTDRGPDGSYLREDDELDDDAVTNADALSAALAREAELRDALKAARAASDSPATVDRIIDRALAADPAAAQAELREALSIADKIALLWDEGADCSVAVSDYQALRASCGGSRG